MAYTTINKSTDYFNTKLYTGNGSARSITGVGFQPDLTWIKSRSATHEHKLIDAVRGVTKVLCPNDDQVEFTDSQGLTAFASDGFSIGTDSYYNTNGNNYAAWNWKAGGGQGSSNTDGSINTTYTSANTTAGFSISKYTGTGSNATVGHGLGVAPSMVIIKRIDSANDWRTGSSDLTSWVKHLNLNTTSAAGDLATAFNSTAPTSSVFSVGSSASTNASSGTFIAYCFADVVGYSKCGSYVGNGSSDGTFVYTGFKPKFLMVKRYDASGDDWYIFDSARDTDNTVDKFLYPNVNASEGNTSNLDFLSNGFKWKKASAFSPVNADGATYIFMAFGQSLVGSNNVPCTAR
jgi:hypothetical protein